MSEATENELEDWMEEEVLNGIAEANADDFCNREELEAINEKYSYITTRDKI